MHRARPTVLKAGHCQVWWAPTSMAPSIDSGVLDRTETTRWRRFRRGADRDRYAIGVWITRTVLGAELGVEPRHVPLDRTCPDCAAGHGRPRLVADAAARFSVAHGGGLVAVAFTLGGAIGVDVEPCTTGDTTNLVDLVLSRAERAALADTPPAEHSGLVLRSWVRKEAVVKAVGLGLAAPLPELTLATAGASPLIVRWAGRDDDAARIQLRDLAGPPGRPLAGDYLASLAVKDLPAPQVCELDARDLR